MNLHDTDLAPDILDFVSRQNILHYLLTTLGLIEHSFSNIKRIHLELEEDPEIDEQYIMIDVTLVAGIYEALKMYNTYTDRLVQVVPWPERNAFRLSYDIR